MAGSPIIDRIAKYKQKWFNDQLGQSSTDNGSIMNPPTHGAAVGAEAALVNAKCDSIVEPAVLPKGRWRINYATADTE